MKAIIKSIPRKLKTRLVFAIAVGNSSYHA